MADVRQRRHIADRDRSGDVSEVTRLEDKDVSFKKDQRSVEQLDDEAKRRLKQPSDEETLWDVTLEVFLPYIVAGLGMATTGITLNYVKVSVLILFLLLLLFSHPMEGSFSIATVCPSVH